MNKKGFTLVEVMAVIVIMAILLSVTVPSVMNSLDKNKNKEHNRIIEEMEEAAKLYVSQNVEVSKYLNEIGNIDVSYETLVKEGLVDDNLIDPLTQERWTKDCYISLNKEDRKIITTYNIGTKPATISINCSNIQISTTENYLTNKLLENLIVSDETGQSYKNAVNYICKINKTGESNSENCKSMKNIPGTHEITYILKYNGNTFTQNADVIVN